MSVLAELSLATNPPDGVWYDAHQPPPAEGWYWTTRARYILGGGKAPSATFRAPAPARFSVVGGWNCSGVQMWSAPVIPVRP